MNSSRELPLNDPTGFLQEVDEHRNFSAWNSERKLFCWSCRASRRMRIVLVVRRAVDGNFYLGTKMAEAGVPANSLKQIAPTLALVSCHECKAFHILVAHPFEDGHTVSVLRCYAAASKTGIPEPVAFYLDQAYRSLEAGANSAAVGMYRSALDQVLYEQGFKNGTVGRKIEDMKDAIKNGTAPPWTRGLDSADLRIISNLGAGAVHARSGDVKQQAELDLNLVQILDEFFEGLLYRIYEGPDREGKLRDALNEKVKALESKPKK